jgi:sodium/bile acid cotransporter 7
VGLGVAIGFAAALPRLGATGGYIRAEYSIKLPAIILIFIISGLGLKTKALLTAVGDLRIHFLVQVRMRGGGTWGFELHAHVQASWGVCASQS